MLAYTIYLSFAGALLMALLPKDKPALARWLALGVAVSGLALIPRDVRRMRTRAGEIPPGEAVLAGERVPDTGAITAGS